MSAGTPPTWILVSDILAGGGGLIEPSSSELGDVHLAVDLLGRLL